MTAPHELPEDRTMRWRVTCEHCPFVRADLPTRVDAISIGHVHVGEKHHGTTEEWGFRVQGFKQQNDDEHIRSFDLEELRRHVLIHGTLNRRLALILLNEVEQVRSTPAADPERDRELLEASDEMIRELLDVLTGWVGNLQMRLNPKMFNSTRANAVLARLNERLQ